MSAIQSASGGGFGGFNTSATRKKPPDLTKDQLTQLDQKLKAAGKDTTNLDKIVANFDQLDTDKDGKISAGELQSTNAQQLGIQAPKGHGHHHHKGGGAQGTQSSQSLLDLFSGPPPGLLSTSADGTASGQSGGTTQSSSTSSYLTQLVQSFGSSDPEQSDSSSTSIAA